MTVIAPILILTTGTTDHTPEFQLIGDIQIGDVESLAFANISSFVGSTVVTNTVSTAEFTSGTLSFPTGSLSNGTWYFLANTNRAGDISAWSNVQSITLSGGITVYSWLGGKSR